MSEKSRLKQTIEVVEALLVLTVPVAQREAAFDELVALGFPLLLVERWEDVTQELLTRMYGEFYPRLQAFRQQLLATNWYGSLGLSRRGGADAVPPVVPPELRTDPRTSASTGSAKLAFLLSDSGI